MEAALQYFLQFSIALTLFYCLYLLILKNETFYNANRFYLVSGLLLAIFLPLFPITYTTPISLINNTDFFSLSENQLSENATTANVESTRNSWTYMDFLITIYISGAILFLARLLWQTMKVFQKIKKSNYKIIEGIKIIDQADIMPFSFFNVVFIDIQKYSEKELSNILAHEKVHIQERHWIDLLIIELLLVLFWINPVVWLYERSIKQNHEFLADQGVLLAGYHPGQYQALLINQLMGVKVLGFAHNLNFSLNKKRMKMMKRERSAGSKKIKLLLALPIIALLIFAFAKKEYSMIELRVDSPTKKSSDKKEIILEKPVYITGEVVTLDEKPIEGAVFSYSGEVFNGMSDRKGHFLFEVPDNFNYYESEVEFGDGKKGKGMRILVTRPGFANSSILLDLSKKTEPMKVWMRQDITVTGRVISNEDRPMDGVNIIQKGTSNGTVTGANGSFSLESSQNSILVFSHVGYKTINYALVDQSNQPVEIVMKKGVFNIELPDINNPDFKMQLPPPPPPEDYKKVDKELLYNVIEQMPYYQNGGIPRLALDLKGEIGWTKNSTTDRGETIVGFTVSVESKVRNPHVVKSSGSKVLDESAVKIIAKLDNWWAGIQRGKRVPVDMTVPVRFE